MKQAHKTLLRTTLLLILCWTAWQDWPTTVQICGPERNFSIRMPRKDKKRLEFFFREVCFVGVWSYTLLGSKPMSVDQYTKQTRVVREKMSPVYLKATLFDHFSSLDWRKICYLLNPHHLKMKLGWNTLNKYISHFPNSRFAIFTDNCENTMCLTLIDKLKVTRIVEQHLADFQDAFCLLKMTPNALHDNKKLDEFSKYCSNRDDLGGILLGYGRENAKLYCKYKGASPKERPLVSAWLEEESVHLERLSQKDLTFDPWEVSDLFYPRFVCNPESGETKQLKETYRLEREKIIQYYQGKDIVEATLSLLNQTK
jgi:hypothetical protein